MSRDHTTQAPAADSPFSTSGGVEFSTDVTDWRNASGNVRQQLEERAPAWSVLAASGKRRLWAVWATRADATAGKDPVEHGTCESAFSVESTVAAAVARVLAARKAIGPAHQLAGRVLDRWRRKGAQARRNVASTSTCTEARITGYAYAHWKEYDTSSAGPRPSDWYHNARSFDAWTRRWKVMWRRQAHRIVKRTDKLIFVLKEPGDAAVGESLDGVTIAMCWAFDRDVLERGGAQQRYGVAGVDLGAHFSLLEEPPIDLVLDGAENQGTAPDCLKALGLGWPTTLEAVKSAFKRLSLGAHPDHGGTSEAFIALRKAYKQALALVAAKAGKAAA